MSRYHTARLLIESAGKSRPAPALVLREDVAFALDAIGTECIDDLLETEFPGLLKALEDKPDPMEIWRTLAARPEELSGHLGSYWSWDRLGATEHAEREVAGDGVILLHGEVEKRHVDWPRSFAENLSGYDWEKEIYVPPGRPVRLLDIDGEKDGRILKAKVFQSGAKPIPPPAL